jgi:hypothetical protein
MLKGTARKDVSRVRNRVLRPLTSTPGVDPAATRTGPMLLPDYGEYYGWVDFPYYSSK